VPDPTVRPSNYTTGVVGDSLFAYQPMDFKVGLRSFAFLMKVLVGFVVLVPLLLAALVWFIVRRVKRRNASEVLNLSLHA
jgi:hypothetical protein